MEISCLVLPYPINRIFVYFFALICFFNIMSIIIIITQSWCCTVLEICLVYSVCVRVWFLVYSVCFLVFGFWLFWSSCVFSSFLISPFLISTSSHFHVFWFPPVLISTNCDTHLFWLPHLVNFNFYDFDLFWFPPVLIFIYSDTHLLLVSTFCGVRQGVLCPEHIEPLSTKSSPIYWEIQKHWPF